MHLCCFSFKTQCVQLDVYPYIMCFPTAAVFIFLAVFFILFIFI
jgi:hypothetical protein